MRPKKPKATDEGDLFRARLKQVINMEHELVQHAGKINWDWIDYRHEGAARARQAAVPKARRRRVDRPASEPAHHRPDRRLQELDCLRLGPQGLPRQPLRALSAAAAAVRGACPRAGRRPMVGLPMSSAL